MNFFLKMLDYIYINRPVLFFPGWVTMLAGYYTATGESISGFPIPWELAPGVWDAGVFRALVMLGAAMGGCFIFNQLKDVETDQKNNKLFLIGGGYVPVKHAYVEGILLTITSLLLALKFSLS